MDEEETTESLFKHNAATIATLPVTQRNIGAKEGERTLEIVLSTPMKDSEVPGFSFINECARRGMADRQERWYTPAGETTRNLREADSRSFTYLIHENEPDHERLFGELLPQVERGLQMARDTAATLAWKEAGPDCYELKPPSSQKALLEMLHRNGEVEIAPGSKNFRVKRDEHALFGDIAEAREDYRQAVVHKLMEQFTWTPRNIRQRPDEYTATPKMVSLDNLSALKEAHGLGMIDSGVRLRAASITVKDALLKEAIEAQQAVVAR